MASAAGTPQPAGHARAAAATDSREAEEDLEGSDTEAGVPEAVSASVSSAETRQARHRARRASEVADGEELEGKGVRWPDGVGDGRPFEVPVTLDYFQGFLAQAGIPITALPKDGRTLGPQQSMELVPHLLSTPLTLGNFGLRRIAARVLHDVGAGGEVVTRDEHHARIRTFGSDRCLRASAPHKERAAETAETPGICAPPVGLGIPHPIL